MKKYSAIIITFFPNLRKLSKTIELLETKKIHIVIVNNTPNNQLKLNTYLTSKYLTVINNNENFGIAKAQNIALRFLSNKSIYATFLFDQDSSLEASLLNNLINGLSSRVNIVAPITIDKNTFEEIPSYRVNKIGLSFEQYNFKNSQIKSTDLVISSGLLIKMIVFEKIGLFDEIMFIDYVDFEWCFRANYFGEKIYIVPNAIMKHKIGKGLRYFLFLRTNVHQPIRTYYKIKNPLILLSRKHIPLVWTIKEIILSIKCLIIQIIVDNNRLLHIRKGILGFRDGLIVNFKNK